MTTRTKPISRYLLIMLNFFLAIGGFYGSFTLLMDTSGESLQVPISWLENTPFTDYTIPGIILLLTMAFFPTLVTFGLMFHPDWKWAKKLNIYKNCHWAWSFSLYQSIMLILWIDFQIMWVGYYHFIQTFYALLGVVLLIVTMLPPIMNYYQSGLSERKMTLRNVRKLKMDVGR